MLQVSQRPPATSVRWTGEVVAISARGRPRLVSQRSIGGPWFFRFHKPGRRLEKSCSIDAYD